MDAVLNWDKVLMAFAAALALGVSALATAWRYAEQAARRLAA